jgi:ATP-binding cassette subfamily B protein
MKTLAVEVLQTSGMDCGPAALKSLLAGLGVSVNYERLREACRTSADGTSIDALEDLTLGLGLEAYQEMAPLDDALTMLQRRAPCIAVVNTASGAPHFVVVWRVGRWFVQLMDPARGRTFVTRGAFRAQLHAHRQRFELAMFREWWPGTAWHDVVVSRAARMGFSARLEQATTATDLQHLEAALRLSHRLLERGHVTRQDAPALVEGLVEMQASASEDEPAPLPALLRPLASDAADELSVTGAVVLVVRPQPARHPGAVESHESSRLAHLVGADPPSAGSILWRIMSSNARGLVTSLGVLVVVLVAVALLEMFALRAAFNAGSVLSLPQQRLAGVSIYFAIVAAALFLDTLLSVGIARLGRAMELRTRLALLEKLPRLPDKYFRSRPMSDVTQRSTGLFQVKAVPLAFFTLVRSSIEIVTSCIALIAVFPAGAGYALAGLFFGCVAPYLSVRVREQLEVRAQTHASSLAGLYLDALLGLTPLRTHGGQLAFRHRQDEHLADWRRESTRAVTMLSAVEGVQAVFTLAIVTGLLLRFLREGENQGALLLVVFWALRLPLQARAFSTAVQRLPQIRASLARLVEPLTADETTPYAELSDERTMVFAQRPGIALRVMDLSVMLGTKQVLNRVSVEIRPGERVAIVGNSGAGKSSLISAILGLIDADTGDIRVDGIPLDRFDVGRLRRETVWVDPVVQLWDQPIIDNIRFGNAAGARFPLHPVIEALDLKDLLQRLPDGMATPLGESGTRVSGGEGQRVRAARALLRRGARLVLLDEAFRGLERATRCKLSRAVRSRVGRATVLEVTHDVADTQDFDRVVVIEDGRLVEQGTPAKLLADPASRYAALVRDDELTQRDVWSATHWKRFVVGGNGQIDVHPAYADASHGEPATERVVAGDGASSP